MLRTMLLLILATAPAMAQKPRLAPPPKPPHCTNHSEVYAPACPRLKKGYCKGDFQLCDLG